MKLNKKLLMAALAGAIVVTGGSGSFADGEPNPAPVVEPGKDTNQEENNENGYSTKEAAEAAAKKALEKDLVNNAYEVEKNNDGKWYYTLKIEDSQGKQPSNPGKTEGKQPSSTGKTKKQQPSNAGKTKNNPKKDQGKNKSKQNKNQKADKKLKKQTKEKKKLPKAGNEAEILTLAAASLSSVAGAFISLKKRK